MKNDLICILRKVTGGRFILTILIGIVFLKLGDAVCALIVAHAADFKPEIIVAMFTTLLGIVSTGMAFYFALKNRKPNGEGEAQ